MQFPIYVSPSVIIAFLMVLGLIQCFFGYRAFKGLLVVVGFIIGYALGFEAIVSVFHNRYAAFFVALIVGVVCGALSTRVYLVGVFVIAALFGVGLAMHGYAITGDHVEPAMLFICAVVSGVLALYFQKLMIVVVTGLAGAWGVVAGVAHFVTAALDPLRMNSVERFFHSDNIAVYVVAACWLALGLAGIGFQYKRPPKFGEQAPDATPRAAAR